MPGGLFGNKGGRDDVEREEATQREVEVEGREDEATQRGVHVEVEDGRVEVEKK